MIIRKKELLSINQSIEMVSASVIITPSISIGKTVEEYLEFCKKRNVDTIFYDYRYYDIDG